MGVKVAQLFAALGLDSKEYDKGLGNAERRSHSWSGRMGGIFKKAGKAIALGLAVGAAAIAAIGVIAANNAVEQERATARVAATYGESGAAVTKWAQDNARAMGVNDDVLELSMAKYGDWAKNVGMSTDEAMANGQDMVKRAQEISLATGKSFEEVFNGLFKGQQGMTRGLKEYGVTIDKAALQNEALRMGWIKEGEALDAATAARARGNLIMQQTGQFTAIATDMQDGMIQKQRQVGVVVDEVMDALGIVFLNLAEVILPVVVDALMGFGDWLAENMPTIQAIVSTAVQIIGDVINWLAVNVIPVLVDIFSALFSQAQTHGPAFMEILTTVFGVVTDAINWVTKNVIPPLMKIIAALVAWFSANMPTISSVAKQVFGAISSIIRAVWPVVEKVGTVLFPIVGAAASVLFSVLDGVFKGIGGVFEFFGAVAKAVFQAVTGIWRGMSGFFEKHLGGVGKFFKGVVNTIIDIVNGFLGFLNNLRIDIPRIDVGPVHVGGGSIDPFDFPTIPKLAIGARNFGGGLAWVGEKGPELVNLPRGADVFTATQSRGMVNGRVEVVIRDPDRAIAQGGYSQSALERALGQALGGLASDLHRQAGRV